MSVTGDISRGAAARAPGADAGGFARTFVVLTCRVAHSDFRLPIARELARLGHRVFYVFLKRRPDAYLLSADGTVLEPVCSGLRALWTLCGRLRRDGGRLTVLNSTNLAFPVFSRLLRIRLGGTWCLDLHDDLLYGTAGLSRRRAEIAQAILLQGSDLQVHSAPSLAELFPGSHHLGNASDVEPSVRTGFDAGRVLILASLDRRMDFDLLDAVAERAPDTIFDIHGQVAGGDPEVRARLDRLTGRRANVRYHGPYRAADLTALLARYDVTLAPYVTESRLTRYLDPLRYYHCLRSGMELVTTPIPAAADLDPLLHVARTPDEIAAILLRLGRDPAARRNAGPPPERLGWAGRARRFLDIVAAQESRRGGAAAA
jgi:glycosyltransferase involved in cell wall biosynthesis